MRGTERRQKNDVGWGKGQKQYLMLRLRNLWMKSNTRATGISTARKPLSPPPLNHMFFLSYKYHIFQKIQQYDIN